MANTLTTNLKLKKPDYKDGRWDVPLNENFDKLDLAAGGMISKNIIINGDLAANNRNADAAVFSSGDFPLDRIQIFFKGGSMTAKRRIPSLNEFASPIFSGSKASNRLDINTTPGNASGDYSCVSMKTPLYPYFSGKEFTFSFISFAASDMDLYVEVSYFNGTTSTSVAHTTVQAHTTLGKSNFTFTIPAFLVSDVTNTSYLQIKVYTSLVGTVSNSGMLYCYDFRLVQGESTSKMVINDGIYSSDECLKFYYKFPATIPFIGCAISTTMVEVAPVSLPVVVRPGATLTFTSLKGFIGFTGDFTFYSAIEGNMLPTILQSAAGGLTVGTVGDIRGAGIVVDAEL